MGGIASRGRAASRVRVHGVIATVGVRLLMLSWECLGTRELRAREGSMLAAWGELGVSRAGRIMSARAAGLGGGGRSRVAVTDAPLVGQNANAAVTASFCSTKDPA
jgi:hypothetical protein